MQEPHREQDELRGNREVRAVDPLERGWRSDLVAVELRHSTIDAAELGGHPAVAALAALLVRTGGAQDQRPPWPGGEIVGAVERRLGHHLELGDARRALAVRVAEAVRAGVAPADDHDVLPG